MELLLVTKQEVAPGKAPGAFGTFERLLLCVRPFMALEVLETGERARAGTADVGSRLVGLQDRLRRSG